MSFRSLLRVQTQVARQSTDGGEAALLSQTQTREKQGLAPEVC